MNENAEYIGFSQAMQMYEKPDTFIGITTIPDVEQDIYLSEDNPTSPRKKIGRFVKEKINISTAFIHMFREILSNATDNVIQSILLGIDPGNITVNVKEDGWISIENEGKPITVKKVKLVSEGGITKPIDVTDDKNKKDDSIMWQPQFIFGTMNTSSNYNDKVKRIGAGKNGFGAKIVNVFSKEFIVTCQDPNSKLIFRGEWKNNMYIREDGKPKIEVKECKKEGSKTKIEWLFDFERFGCEPGFSEEDIGAFARACVESSFSAKVVINFNGEKLNYKNSEDFSRLIWNTENVLPLYSWKDNKKYNKLAKKEKEKIVDNPQTTEEIPIFEVLVLDTPDAGDIKSYCNGQVTDEGGIHVNAVVEEVYKYVSSLITERFKKENKGVEEKVLDKYKPEKVKNHISLIVNAHVENPKYASQTKSKLVSLEDGKKEIKKLKFEIEEDQLKSIAKWKSIEYCMNDMNSLAGKAMKKLDGNKSRFTDINKLVDANKAGTRESKYCTLYLVEGDSADTGIATRIGALPGNTDYNGRMPLRGKILNTVKKGKMAALKNAEIINIIQAIGGKIDNDLIKYDKVEDISKLRYGRVIIAADADVDGYHITCLLISLFEMFFPGLLKLGYLYYLRTPILRLEGKRADVDTLNFFTKKEFEIWEKNNKKIRERYQKEPKYFKGLGSSSDSEIKLDVNIAPVIRCYYDKEAKKYLNIGFGKSSELRKKWIMEGRGVVEDEIVDMLLQDDYYSIFPEEEYDEKNNLKIDAQNIAQIIDVNLRSYSLANLVRSIIGEDFYKESQRLAVYHCLKRFNYGKNTEQVKVSQIASYIADNGSYEHGDTNLQGLIINLACNYPGTNNMPFFTRQGQFGNRQEKKSASPRYIFVGISSWVDLIYDKYEVELVEKHKSDGIEVCPKWIPGTIPLGLVNGGAGVATGWSFFIPCYNPMDITDWFIAKCRGEETFYPVPWYNYFSQNKEIKVKINEKITSTPKRDLEEDNDTETVLDEDEDEESEEKLEKAMDAKNSKYSMTIKGDFDIVDADSETATVIVKELAIYSKLSFIVDYCKWCNSQAKKWSDDKTKYQFVHDFDKKIHLLLPNGKPLKKDNGKNNLIHKPEIKIVVSTCDKNGKKQKIDHKKLFLEKTCGLSNITLIGSDGYPNKYPDIRDAMEIYYLKMIDLYSILIKNKIKDCEKVIEELGYKIKFNTLVVNREIEVINRDEELVYKDMENNGIPRKTSFGVDVYDTSKTKNFSKQGIEKMEKELELQKGELNSWKKMNPQKYWLRKLDKLKEYLAKNRKDNGGEYYDL